MAVGLNTCMFVVIFTQNSIFGWHYNNKHNDDYIIINYLNHIEKNNLFVAGYIIHGKDRNEYEIKMWEEPAMWQGRRDIIKHTTSPRTFLKEIPTASMWHSTS
jgi:hypothetical protein